MTPTKPCEQCGKLFLKRPTDSKERWPKRRFCSRGCKAASQQGMPPWNKGLHRESKKQYIPCRICGEPTKHPGGKNHPYYHGLACEKPECIEASRVLKNERIAERAREMYANGSRRKIRYAWKRVRRISPEEELITPWFEGMGWTPQHRVLTGVHTNTLPRVFDLDFALPERKLYVEIDGDIHRLRKERDARRDQMLTERGWQGLRIPANIVRENPDAAKQTVTGWLDKLH